MIAAACRVRQFVHGERRARAVVLLHGLSNCPQQFDRLGQQLYERGDNVLIPRMPHHGYADRLTDVMRRLTAHELTAATDEAIDIARGLGETLVVAGLSAGGLLAAWAAQERSDVNRAIIISPAFAPYGWDRRRVPLLTPLILLLPNRFMWWDSERRETIGPAHAYPRFSTRALAQLFSIGTSLFRKARREKPKARSMVMVTNDADRSVSAEAADELVQLWRAHGATIEEYRFTGLPAMLHDLIDPAQPGQRVEQVYPVLIRLIQDETVE